MEDESPDLFISGLPGIVTDGSNYDPRRFGYEVLNGTQWELEIFFSDGHKPMKICGSNSYPYNFNKFLELLGIEPMEGEEDTDDE